MNLFCLLIILIRKKVIMFCWMQNNQYNLFWDSNSLSFFDIINYFCSSVWLLFCFGIISFCCYFRLSSANLSSLDFVISYSSFCVQNASISFPFCVQRLLHRKLQYFFVCVIIWKGKREQTVLQNKNHSPRIS